MSIETEYVQVSKNSKIPVITFFIILVNVIVFIYMDNIADSDGFVEKYSNIPQLTMTGDYWRLLSNFFIHSAMWHLTANMLMLLWAGFECERVYGRERTLALYLLSGIGATLFSAIYHIDSLMPFEGNFLFWRPSILMSLGASGAIMGILAANLVMLIAVENHPYRGEKSFSSTVGVIALTLLYGLKSGVDNISHLGGLLSGGIVGIAYFYVDNKIREKHKIAGLLVAFVGAGLIGLYYHMKVNSVLEEYKPQRNDIIEYFKEKDLSRKKEAEKEKKIMDAKVAEAKRLSDAKKLHDSLPHAVDSETAMGAILDIPAVTSVVVSHGGDVFYVAAGGVNSIIILDSKTYKKTGEITPPECKSNDCEHDPVSTLVPSPDGKTLYATSLVKDSLSVIDLTTNTIETNISVGKMPNHMVISPDGSMAWVLNQLDNSITAVDLENKKVLKEINLPGKYDEYSSNFNFRPIAISHDGNTLAAYDTVESKLLTLNTKTFQLQGTGFVLENAGNITSIAFSKNDNSLWLSGGEGVEQLDIRSGNVLNSFSWCGEQFRSSDILFTLLDPDQGQLLLTAHGTGGVYLVLYDLETRSNIGQYPTHDNYGFPRLNLEDGRVMQGNYAHLQIAHKNNSLITDPSAIWLCERNNSKEDLTYYN